MSRSCAALMRRSSSGRASLLFSLASFSSALATSAALAEDPSKSVELPPVTVDVGDQSQKAKQKAGKLKSKSNASKSESAATAKNASPAEAAQGGGAAATANADTDGDIGIPLPDAQGDIGYRATRSSSATKTDTPLRNIPQSISVITDKEIKDKASQNIGDVVKYVPGIEIHQGEGNRDQISIRGQNASTADFFVNGVRDDAQVFRDLYNTERLEVLKGPAALAFGRGGAGGVLNRVTKQADFATHDEATVEVGSFDHKRAVIDVDRKITADFGARITSMFEDSGSYRDGVDLQRWGINPTLAFRPWDRTTVALDYEHYEDHRTADRGIPSERAKG